jgi:hypothetical protein
MFKSNSGEDWRRVFREAHLRCNACWVFMPAGVCPGDYRRCIEFIVGDGVSLSILWNEVYSNMLNNSRERNPVCRAGHMAVSVTSYFIQTLRIIELSDNKYNLNYYSHNRMSCPAGVSLRVPFQNWRWNLSEILVEHGVRLSFALWEIGCKAFCINRTNYGVKCISFIMEALHR